MATELRLDTPVFVGGAGSSGSSLLAVMLNRHPQIYCGGETSLFNKPPIFGDFNVLKRQLPVWLKKGLPTDGYAIYPKLLPHAERDPLTPDILCQCLRHSQTTRQFVDAIQTHCLNASGKEIFAEKTPSNAYCFRQFVELYPKCLLIHPVRDGRDVVCSFMRRGFDVFFATSAWLYNVACAVSCRGLPNYFEYRYEDLVKDPSLVLQEICERLSIPFDARMLQPTDTEKKQELGAWRSSTLDHISPKSVGQYKTELAGTDYALFSAVRLTGAGSRRAGTPNFSAIELLELFNYPIESRPGKVSWTRAKQLELRDMYRRFRYYVRLGWLPRPSLTRVAG